MSRWRRLVGSVEVIALLEEGVVFQGVTQGMKRCTRRRTCH